MSTKSTNQALINAIADGEPNSAMEARTAWNGLLNELYPTVYYSAWNAPIKTVSLFTGFRYFVTFSKSGSNVFMNGTFITAGTIPINNDVFSFSDVEFGNLNNGSDILNMVVMLGGYRFRMTNGVFRNLDAIPASTTIYLNFTYPTNP